MNENLAELLGNLKEKEAIEIVNRRLDNGEDASAVFNDVRKGMEIVGDRFAAGEYYLPDLIYSGVIMRQISEVIKPKLSNVAETKKLGKIVLGTVAGDIHDIGLNIVDFILDMNGFEVFNLGVDVPADKFVEKIKETGAPIVAMSGLLTLAFDSMKDTVQAIEAAGLRDKVKIMIGGCKMDEEVKIYTSADAYGTDAMSAVTLAKQWIGGN